MISATIKEKANKIVGYEISGHAESGEYGHDVVCAAVSVLGITTANNLYNIGKVKPLAEMKDGYLKVEIPITLSKKQEEVTQLLMQAFKNAMTEVTDEYGDFIELKIGGQNA